MIIFSKYNPDSIKYLEIFENYYVAYNEWMVLNELEQHLEICKFINNRRNNIYLTGQSSCAIREISRLDKYDIRPHSVTTTKKGSDFICWRMRKTMPNTELIDGIQVVNCLDTIVDLAKYDTTESLLVSINDCLNKRYFTIQEFLNYLDVLTDRHHKKTLLRLMKIASDKCESPLETIAWIAIYKAGFILPEQQVKIVDKANKGIFYSRVDMCWKIRRRTVILELDGKIKYSDKSILFAEKKREDQIRAMGYVVIRATWKDVVEGRFVKLLDSIKIPKRRYRNQTIFK